MIFVTSISLIFMIIFLIITVIALPLLIPYAFLFACTAALAVYIAYVRMKPSRDFDEKEKKWVYRMCAMLFFCVCYLFVTYFVALVKYPGGQIPG